MAKKTKVSSKSENCTKEICEYSPTIYVDFDDVKEIEGLSVGDTVRVMVKGTVRSVEQREGYDEAKTRCSVSIKDFDAEIISNETDFDALLEDEDE